MLPVTPEANSMAGFFVWDENKREITVQTLGPQPRDRRFGIQVWSAAPRN